MKSNRLIFIISLAFSFLVTIPKLLFLARGKNDQALNQVIDASWEDAVIRFLLLLLFSFVVLKFNLHWLERFQGLIRKLIYVSINLLIFAVWVFIFNFIQAEIFNIYASVISPKLNTVTYFFFLIVMLLISKSLQLIEKSKLDSLEKERLKKKSLQNELDALKNQINPHFLFNSLNTLTCLVREDQKAAGKFISKLSFLYRYILQSQDKELVTVKEELKVVNSYTHLIKERYRNNFKVTTQISEELTHRKIPVLALQTLLENAVKHNEISEQKPLLVEFYNEDDYLVVANTLQMRKAAIESTQKGLNNLYVRSKLSIGKEVIILKTERHFIVKIPTL